MIERWRLRTGARRALAGLVAVVVVAGCSDPSPGDPGVTTQDLWESADEGDWLEPLFAGQVVHIRPGETVTDSLDTVTMTRDGELRVLDVRSDGGEESLEFLGALIAPPERRIMDRYQYPRFPPSTRALGTPALEVDEPTIVPDDETRREKGFRLLLGYRFTADELGVRDSYEILYEVEDEVFRQTMPSVIAACPSTMREKRCADAISAALAENGDEIEAPEPDPDDADTSRPPPG